MKHRSLARLALPAVAGFLIAVAGVAFFQVMRNAADEQYIVVANKVIEPYSVVKGDAVRKESVAKSSITREDLEWSEYEEQYLKKNKPLMVSQQLLPGQRIDERVISKNELSNFAVVSPDERVIGVSAAVPGAVLGKVHVGDVVNVTAQGSGSNEGARTQFAKVLCVSASPGDCEARPDGVATGSDDDPTTAGGEEVKLLLAVQETDAAALAGQVVTLSLNPFCRIAINPEGSIEVGDFLGEQCVVPSERYASSRMAPGASEEEGGSSRSEGGEAASDDSSENSAPSQGDDAGLN